MPSYYIGDFIRETRLRRGYTQEQLSFGICTPASLSRIETGAQTPGIHILDSLLQRLGIENEIFDVFESKKEMEICELLDEVTRNIADRDGDSLKIHTKMLEETIGEGNHLQRQYLIFAKGVLKKMNGASSEEVMEMFMQAIRMTLPDFDGVTPPEENLLTFHEISIINNIAILHAKEGRMDQALALGFWLKSYMERRLIDGKEKRKKYPMILYNLTNWLGKSGRDAEVLQVAEEGIDFCIRQGTLFLLPMLIFNKGCALATLGEREQAKRFFQQATVIFEATKQEQRAKETVALCKEHYNIEI